MPDCNSAEECSLLAIESAAAYEERRTCLLDGYCPVHGYGHTTEEMANLQLRIANNTQGWRDV